jgi:hypothetical protein
VVRSKLGREDPISAIGSVTATRICKRWRKTQALLRLVLGPLRMIKKAALSHRGSQAALRYTPFPSIVPVLGVLELLDGTFFRRIMKWQRVSR